MMKSQKMSDNCSVCDIFLRVQNRGEEEVGKECKVVWRSKVKRIQGWGIDDIWLYLDKM